MTCPFLHLFSSGGRKNILRKNQYIQRENKGLRRSKYLALETVREATGARNRVGDVGRIRETLLSHKPETKVYKWEVVQQIDQR